MDEWNEGKRLDRQKRGLAPRKPGKVIIKEFPLSFSFARFNSLDSAFRESKCCGDWLGVRSTAPNKQGLGLLPSLEEPYEAEAPRTVLKPSLSSNGA